LDYYHTCRGCYYCCNTALYMYFMSHRDVQKVEAFAEISATDADLDLDTDAILEKCTIVQ